jgi:hypothetical protein
MTCSSDEPFFMFRILLILICIAFSSIKYSDFLLSWLHADTLTWISARPYLLLTVLLICTAFSSIKYRNPQLYLHIVLHLMYVLTFISTITVLPQIHVSEHCFSIGTNPEWIWCHY